jgi:hypothetical protein
MTIAAAIVLIAVVAALAGICRRAAPPWSIRMSS